MGAGASVESLNVNGLAEVRTAGIARIPGHMARRILPLFQAAEAKGMPSIVTDTIICPVAIVVALCNFWI